MTPRFGRHQQSHWPGFGTCASSGSTELAVSTTLAGIDVSLIHGTPLLQVFVIYYGLPSIGIGFAPVTPGTLALSLNAGTYLSKNIRGAIFGVGKRQWAASYSLGLSYAQTLRHIVMPQALHIALPSMSNTLISLIKDVSLVSVITVTELMFATKEVIATTFRPLPPAVSGCGTGLLVPEFMF